MVKNFAYNVTKNKKKVKFQTLKQNSHQVAKSENVAESLNQASIPNSQT